MGWFVRCLGLEEASRSPVKRYNLLTPKLFPKEPPPLAGSLDKSIIRNISKLCEYCEKNPEKVPKVSRRLQRRIVKELGKERFGYVKVAVTAFISILGALPSTVPLVGPQVVSVCSQLLPRASVELRLLGISLLTAFCNAQVTTSYVDQMERFLPRLCTQAQAGRLQTDMHQNRGDELRVAALGALKEVIRLMARCSTLIRSQSEVLTAVLDNLHDHPRLAKTSRPSQDDAEVAGHPATISLLALREMMHMDDATVKRAVDGVTAYLTEHRLWSPSGLGGSAPREETFTSLAFRAVRNGLDDNGRRFHVLLGLLRHLCDAEPGDATQIIINEINAEVEHSGQFVMGSALVAVLRQLPIAVAKLRGADRERALEVPRLVATKLDDALQVVEAITSALYRTTRQNEEAACVLLCLCEAAEAIATYAPAQRHLPSRSFPQLLLERLCMLLAPDSRAGVVSGSLLLGTLRLTQLLLPLADEDGLRSEQVAMLLAAVRAALVGGQWSREAGVAMGDMLALLPQHVGREGGVLVAAFAARLLEGTTVAASAWKDLVPWQSVAVADMANRMLRRLVEAFADGPKASGADVELPGVADAAQHLSDDTVVQQMLMQLRAKGSATACRDTANHALQVSGLLQEVEPDVATQLMASTFEGNTQFSSSIAPRYGTGRRGATVAVPPSGSSRTHEALQEASEQQRRIQMRVGSISNRTGAPAPTGVINLLSSSLARDKENIASIGDRPFVDVVAECTQGARSALEALAMTCLAGQGAGAKELDKLLLGRSQEDAL
ncbi:unnamed protein product [Pedinophyceae sp. YPF-701]|nr:unnamed protein product [Pedinophyceae sp. YPF-701]